MTVSALSCTVGRYRHACCKAHIMNSEARLQWSRAMQHGSSLTAKVRFVTFLNLNFGPCTLTNLFQLPDFAQPVQFTAHSEKLWFCEHQNHVGYSWPCKMLGAQSFPNTGYFWYGPYASWGREIFTAQNINKDWLELFQGRQSDRKRGRVYTCHSMERQWQMDEEWVAATGSSCTKFPVRMRKQGDRRQAGRLAGCASGPDWSRFSSSQVSIHVGHQLTGILFAFPN